jgi:hypothetical protein
VKSRDLFGGVASDAFVTKVRRLLAALPIHGAR